MGLLSTPPHLFICGAVFLHAEAKSGNFCWLSRKKVGGLAQRGASNGTPVPHSGEDRVNDLVFGQQLPPQLASPPGEGTLRTRQKVGCFLHHSEWAQSGDQHPRVVRIPGHQPCGQSGKWAECVGPGKPAHTARVGDLGHPRPTLYESAARWRFGSTSSAQSDSTPRGAAGPSQDSSSPLYCPGTRA